MVRLERHIMVFWCYHEFNVVIWHHSAKIWQLCETLEIDQIWKSCQNSIFLLLVDWYFAYVTIVRQPKAWLDSHFNKEQIHANWWTYWHTPNIWRAFQSGLPNCLLTLRQISSNPKSPRWFYFFHQTWRVRHPKCEEHHTESSIPIFSPTTSSSNLFGHFTGIVQMKVSGTFGRLISSSS